MKVSKKNPEMSGATVLLEYLRNHKGPISEKHYKELLDQNIRLYIGGHIDADELQRLQEELANMGYNEARNDGKYAFFGQYPER